VFTFPKLASSELDDLVLRLPRDYALGSLGEARLVAGPPGAFILRAAGDDLEREARELLQVTNATRVALSDHLHWVPFLDALLVTGGENHQHPDVTLVPADMLLDVIRDGHQPLDESTMDRLFVLLAERRLRPAWRLMGCEPGLGDPSTASARAAS
jgi:hypothetical protein